MRTSQYLLATLKETPAGADIISHQLMLRAGMIRQLSSGMYTWLPLGLRVLTKVSNIVRREMDRIGGAEVLMSAVQPAHLWEETGRWQDFWSILFKLEDRNERQYYLGPTHEEVITDFMRRELKSYKQLPLTLYQIQTKYRDEYRPRFGVMRSREFLMKDAYTFNIDPASLQQSYQLMYQAYCNIFNALGVNYRAVEADSGGMGGNVSHEFHVLADSGEDEIIYSDEDNFAANKELYEQQMPDNIAGELKTCRGIEVGHIFQLGTKYSQSMNLTLLNEQDEQVPVHMGCYGIGISRVVAAAIEQNYDDHGIMWPEPIAPFEAVIIAVNYHDENVRQAADALYQDMNRSGVDVLLDDRDERAGVKFSEMDLIGIPHQYIISPRNIANNQVEYKNRFDSDNRQMLSLDEAVNFAAAL